MEMVRYSWFINVRMHDVCDFKGRTTIKGSPNKQISEKQPMIAIKLFMGVSSGVKYF